MITEQVDGQTAEVQHDLQETVSSQKLTNNKEIIAYLAQKFPHCFSVEGEAKPLKIGIFQDLAAALQDDALVSKTQLRQALRQYTSNWRYLHGCKVGAERVDLQGNVVGMLEQEHADHAAQQLAEAKAKVAEKRKAERASSNAETKKRSASRKLTKPNSHRQSAMHKPKVELKPVSLDSLGVGAQVRVKAGDKTQRATVLEVNKDDARVQLQNGLVITVNAERLLI